MQLGRVKSVDSVMAVFTKTMDQLETVAEANDAEAVVLIQQKAALDSKIECAEKESKRARRIRESLANVLSID